MSWESIQLQDQRPSTSQQDPEITNTQRDVFEFPPDAFYHPTTPEASDGSEPHMPNTVHHSASVSGQTPLQSNISSQASLNSLPLQFDLPLSSPTAGDTTGRISAADQLKRRHEALKQDLQDLPYTGDRMPRTPMAADFTHYLQVQIIPKYPQDHIKHVVVLLHEYAGNELSLEELASYLHRERPETSFVLLRGPKAVPTPNGGYHWADGDSEWNGPFLSSEEILTQMIKSSLIKECGFAPRNILLMGHGQGGMAVLATAALWEDVELGGAVSIGGPLPSYARSAASSMIKTPALVVGGRLGDLNPSALECIKNRFATVDKCILDNAHDTVPDTGESRKPLLEFLAHRLQREEWRKQAVISFDGGGIRGYGSLLILQELMNKIGDEEKRHDVLDGQPGKTESSFAPGLYKPQRRRTTSDSSLIDDDPTTATNTSRSDIKSLPNSSLFLPCHYFDYAVGTSTGGLISIMLSRLRMTVDDCISEYKSFGQKIFGRPRPGAHGGILWHKFDYNTLEKVIQDVTERHSEQSEEFTGLSFPSDEDICRTLVMTYAEHSKTDAPYLFRTYYTPPPSADWGRTKQRQTMGTNDGPPPNLSIWQVGRATSAAPKYFPPVRIDIFMDDCTYGPVRFKDGGFGCNNPSQEAYYDIVQKHGDFSGAVGPFISIGTGETRLDRFAKGSGNLRNAIANFKAANKYPARTQDTHKAMTRLSHHDGKDMFPYYRFDGGERLGEVKLDEWEPKVHHLTRFIRANTEPGFATLDKMNVATTEYLHRQDVQHDLDECAKLLVKRRRLRARDDSAWDRFASASYYVCSDEKCPKFRINTKQDYKSHVKKEHYSALRDEPLETAMKTSRRCWIYRNAPPPLE
ncbi:MAG: hypothetical protein Q9193_005056 [Seirophora villosa]